MQKKALSPSVKCVLTLVVIAVVCVAALAVLNDALYVPPDIRIFSNAFEADYTQTDVADVNLSDGKVLMAAEATDESGNELIGLYVESNGYGKADSFTVIIVLNKNTGEIMGSYLKTQGASPSDYNYDPDKLNELVGVNITDIVSRDPDMVITGATNSSYALINAYVVAKEYYLGVYGG